MKNLKTKILLLLSVILILGLSSICYAAGRESVKPEDCPFKSVTGGNHNVTVLIDKHDTSKGQWQYVEGL